MTEQQKQQNDGISWKELRPWVYGIVLGLVVGPLAANLLGLQVSSSTMRERVHDAVVNDRAHYCAELVRQHHDGPVSRLARNEISDLAERYGAPLWKKTIDSEVAYECTSLLDKS